MAAPTTGGLARRVIDVEPRLRTQDLARHRRGVPTEFGPLQFPGKVVRTHDLRDVRRVRVLFRPGEIEIRALLVTHLLLEETGDNLPQLGDLLFGSNFWQGQVAVSVQGSELLRSSKADKTAVHFPRSSRGRNPANL